MEKTDSSRFQNAHDFLSSCCNALCCVAQQLLKYVYLPSFVGILVP
jgi:hypothetical protein